MLAGALSILLYALATVGPGTALVAQQTTDSSEDQQEEWTWKDAKGNIRTRQELDVILAEHKHWVQSEGKSGTRANLRNASLSGANLRNVDLSGTNLSGAELIFADLRNVDLRNARLFGADLSEARFEPTVNPEIRGIAAAENLKLITYRRNSDALAQLRKDFKDGGFLDQERKITYALKRRQAEELRYNCTWRRWSSLSGWLKDLTSWLRMEVEKGSCAQGERVLAEIRSKPLKTAM